VIEDLRAQLNKVEPEVTEDALKGLTLRLEDLADFLHGKVQGSILPIHGHTVQPLRDSTEEASAPIEFWLSGGFQGGEIRLRANDHLHLQGACCRLENVSIIGDGEGSSCSRLLLHGEDAVLVHVALKCCEVHVLGTGSSLQHCSIDGQGKQHTGFLVSGSSPAQHGLLKGIRLCECSVKDATVGLLASDVEEASIVDCQCASHRSSLTHKCIGINTLMVQIYAMHAKVRPSA
jgi:hypothetical protein